MAQVDLGPGSINAVPANSAASTASVFAGQTAGIEVHVGQAVGLPVSGTNPLPPALAPFVDPSQAGTNITGNIVVPINKSVVYGVTGATTVIANPA